MKIQTLSGTAAKEFEATRGSIYCKEPSRIPSCNNGKKVPAKRCKEGGRYHAGNESSEVNKIFQKLQLIYGNKQSEHVMLGNFYARKQLKGESMRQYALALQEPLQKVKIRNPASEINDKAIRDKIINGVGQQSVSKKVRRQDIQ